MHSTAAACSLQHCSWRQFHFICWHCSSASTLQHCSTAATRGSGTQRVTRLLHITRTAALQHVGSCSRLLQCCSELQLQCDTLDTSCPAAAAWSPHMCCSAAVTQPPTDTASGDHHDTLERHFKIILNILLKNMKNCLLHYFWFMFVCEFRPWRHLMFSFS